MCVPSFERLATRDGVRVREKRHEVDAGRYERARERIEGGLEWAVGAVVSREDGRVLLLKERGRWAVPGGEVEDGERLREALVREVREETGVRIATDEMIAVADVSFVHAGRACSFHFAYFTATPLTTALADDPGLDDEGIEAVRWSERLPDRTIDRELVERCR